MAAYALAALLIFPFLGALGILIGILYVGIMSYAFGKDPKKVFSVYTYFPTINTLAGMAVTFFVFFK